MATTVFGIDDASISATAGIQARKMWHRHRPKHSATGTVTSTSVFWFIAKATGTWKTLEAAIVETIATGADRTVTVDLHKSTGGAAFATVLSATIVLDNSNTLRIAEAASFSDTAIADGDIFKLVVTVAGALGNQAEGLAVTGEYDEQPA